MVADVAEAGVLPAGALSVACGSRPGLMDALEPLRRFPSPVRPTPPSFDPLTAAVTQRPVRVNIEADSVNSALLLEGEAPGSEVLRSGSPRKWRAR